MAEDGGGGGTFPQPATVTKKPERFRTNNPAPLLFRVLVSGPSEVGPLVPVPLLMV